MTGDLHLLRLVEALGQTAALDISLASPFLAKASDNVTRDKRGVDLYETSNGTAVITVEGPLARKASVFWGMLWMDGYDRILEAFTKAAKDPDVHSFLGLFDTPGGAANGLGDASREIRAIVEASGKPFIAHSNLAASAGYYLAACADEHYITSDGGVGSIGTYCTHYDMSGFYEKLGIRITPIQDPEGKTAGTFLKPLDEEGRKRLQEVVSTLSESFYEHVGERRNMTPKAVRDLNAKVFYGQSAVKAGLADGVLSVSQAQLRASELAQKRKRMDGLKSLLGLPTTANTEDIEKAASVRVTFANNVLAMTGETNLEAASGAVAAWKKDAAEVAQLREDAKAFAAKQDKEERHSLLVQLAQVEPPSHVWADTSDLSKGPVAELSAMSTPMLRAFVQRRTKTPLPPAMRQSEGASTHEVTDAEVKAYMKENNIKNEAVARNALEKARKAEFAQ